VADLEIAVGAELPDWVFTFKDSTGAVIDLSGGWTFTLKIGNRGSPALYTQTDDITGAATAPNVTVAFDAGDLDTIPPGNYTGWIRARRVSDSKDRDLWFTVHVGAIMI